MIRSVDVLAQVQTVPGVRRGIGKGREAFSQVGTVTFDDVRERLQAEGWPCEEHRITSPSGGYCFDRATFDRDVRAVYFPAARRFHSFGERGAFELGVLLTVLEEHPVLEPLHRYLTLVRLELAASVARYEMTISQWDFGFPSVRATGSHPSSGVAVSSVRLSSAKSSRPLWRTSIPRLRRPRS